MNKLLLPIYLLLFSQCEGQISKDVSKTGFANCNRSVYGSTAYIDKLPPYLCIPAGFIIDDYVRFSDLDGDGSEDVILVKFNKKEDDQQDGDSTYWRFYVRTKSDSTFLEKMTLTNIVPPFIKKISNEYLQKHSLATNLFEKYPRRLSHGHSLRMNSDTIWLSYKFENSYGKRFVFVYDKGNWYLENIEYFIGELPMYWWEDNDFYYPLNDALKTIETKKPRERVLINNFDLTIAFKYSEVEWIHVSEWHVDRVDETKWRSIIEVEFDKCQGIDLPDDWLY